MRAIEKTIALTVAVALSLSAAAHAQCPTDDSFEDNDTCGSFAIATSGLTSGLVVTGASSAAGVDEDFWVIQGVPAGEVLVVDALFTDAAGDLDLELYDDAACTAVIDSSLSTTDDEQVSVANYGSGPVDYYVRVWGWSSSFNCNDYSLQVKTFPDPCQAGADDALEQNDSCGAAVMLGTGLTTGLFVSEADYDYFTIDVPAAELLTVDVSYPGGNGDVDLRLYSDAACATEVDAVASSGGAGRVSFSNTTGGPVSWVLKVEVAAGDGCNSYDLNVVSVTDPCQAGLDDAFEPNDACAAATVLPSGSTTGLFVSDTDADHYLISVPVASTLTVDLTYLPGVLADVDLRLFSDLACTTEVDARFPTTGTAYVAYGNTTGAVTTFVLRVEVAAGEGCNHYDLDVSTAFTPCLDPLADDALEDNDSCVTAVPMFDGTYTGLFAGKLDHDFYTVSVADGDTLFVDLSFTHSVADIDVYIYDDLLGCGDLSSWVARGYSSSNDEHTSWTNSSGSTQTYYVQVLVFFFSSGECNDYDLQITGSDAVLTTSFCFGDGTAEAGGGPASCPCGNLSAVGAGEGCLSSEGVGAILSATGTASVANDDLVFTVAQGRPGEPSMLVQGSSKMAVPFKDGVLCMGNPTERVEIVFLDAAGTGSTTGSIVTNGNIPGPGATRYYQQWYRDPGGVSPCGTGSNFSQALALTWL